MPSRLQEEGETEEISELDRRGSSWAGTTSPVNVTFPPLAHRKSSLFSIEGQRKSCLLFKCVENKMLFRGGNFPSEISLPLITRFVGECQSRAIEQGSVCAVGV